jgi:hypothetical protein
MENDRNREARISSQTIALIIATFVLLVGLFLWGLSSPHVASNPGPSGTPGSTAVNQTPPPAEGPSGGTTGTAR